MGYDMYIETELTEAEALAKSAATDQCDAAVTVRDALVRNTPKWDAAQEQVLAAYEALNKHDLNYFRLNIWGMGKCRAAMWYVGMVYDSDCPQFPEYEPPTSAEGGKAALELAEQEYDERHQAMCEPVVRHHPEGGETIPVHKLCDNSGWLVTEQECAAAVAAWRRHEAEQAAGTALVPLSEELEREPDEEVAATLAGEWWPEWIAFIERAATRGGFRVY